MFVLYICIYCVFKCFHHTQGLMKSGTTRLFIVPSENIRQVPDRII